ncbi:hypothetical protein PQX77_015843 [Marasmius sp. AFHP31]|nr:hypothetical protein PQX77_015843 [Marasmius sp. AFHP31]
MFSNASHFTIVGGLFANVGRDVVNMQDGSAQIYLDQYLRGFCSMNAFFNSGKRDFGAPRCILGTRTKVIDAILKWTSNPSSPGILWLNGLVGEGKSAVAQTVAERLSSSTNMDTSVRLAGSFFFSRGEDDCCQMTKLFTTLAYQLTRFDSNLKNSILGALRADAFLPHAKLAEQLEKLIVNPIQIYKEQNVTRRKRSSPQLLFLIDALDECEDPVSILTAIANGVIAHGNLFRFLVTSRPEGRIRDFFSRSRLTTISSMISLRDYDSRRDVEIYLIKSFSDIKITNATIFRRRREEWPDKSALDRLVAESDGLFAYASSIVNYISHERDSPIQSLQRVLSLQTTVPHSVTFTNDHESDNPYQSLDKLYSEILSAVGGLRSHLCDILGALMVLFTPLTEPDFVFLITNTHTALNEVVYTSITNQLHSVLLLPNDSEDDDTRRTHPIRLYHKSFHSFLANQRRSTVFYINPTQKHGDVAMLCLNVMSRELKQNICQIAQPHYGCLNHDVEGLEELCDLHIPGYLRYACRYWWQHVCSAAVDGDIDGFPSFELPLILFLNSSLLHWIECLSLLGDLSIGLQATRSLGEQVIQVCIRSRLSGPKALTFYSNTFNPRTSLNPGRKG